MRSRVWVLGALAAAMVCAGMLIWLTWGVGGVSSRLSVRDFVSGLAEVQPDLKLVVAHVELMKTMSGMSAKTVMGLDMGVTRAVLIVPARVHYAVDLTAAEPVAFRFDSATRILTAEFPQPAVQAVEVLLHDKRTVIEPGWGRLRERSGKALEEGMERGVYDAVKRDAAQAPALAAVREKARPVLARFLEGYLQRAGLLRAKNGVSAVAVRFKDEPSGLESISR